MRKVLIISPYFPPSNTADMQRVRMSLPYFAVFGWEAEVVTVAPEYSDMVKDCLLKKSLPENLKIHTVGALPKKLTSRFGLGSIAIRSLLHYKQKVNRLLKEGKYDLIYFSTAQFPVCILGRYWKKKHGIPYVIDFQDPWHSEYYKKKSIEERPHKYWFSYHLNRYLEPIAVKECGGFISVSQRYIDDLKNRYPSISRIPASVITFGAFEDDISIVKNNIEKISIAFAKEQSIFNIVYVGRGGADMKKAARILFLSFKKGLIENPGVFSNFRFHFIGTSYAPAGEGKQTILPVAIEEGISEFVFEQTDRIPFYSGLASLRAADGLILLGSDDTGYTASKLYPYILAKKPLLAIFHSKSSIIRIVNECNSGQTMTLDADLDDAFYKLSRFFSEVYNQIIPKTDWVRFENYGSKKMTEKQVMLFEEALTHNA